MYILTRRFCKDTLEIMVFDGANCDKQGEISKKNKTLINFSIYLYYVAIKDVHNSLNPLWITLFKRNFIKLIRSAL